MPLPPNHSKANTQLSPLALPCLVLSTALTHTGAIRAWGFLPAWRRPVKRRKRPLGRTTFPRPPLFALPFVFGSCLCFPERQAVTAAVSRSGLGFRKSEFWRKRKEERGDSTLDRREEGRHIALCCWGALLAGWFHEEKDFYVHAFLATRFPCTCFLFFFLVSKRDVL